MHSVIYSSSNLLLNYLHDHLILKFLENNILGKQIGLLLKIQLFITSELVIKLYNDLINSYFVFKIIFCTNAKIIMSSKFKLYGLMDREDPDSRLVE